MCFGGSSSAENQISQAQQQMMTTLQNDYSQQFKGQQAILNQLSSSVSPILAAGINQFGFSPAEDSALRTLSDSRTAAGYREVKQATDEGMSSIGGGNAFLPSGTSAGIDAGVATKFAQQQSNQQLGITEAGYAQGRENYLNAAKILGGVAGQMDPLGYANAATNTGNAAFGEANTINQQNNAAKQAEFGMLGGALQAGLSFIPGAGDILSNVAGAATPG